MTSQFIGRYEVTGLLGKGGIGQVYEARDTQLGRRVAIKALRPEYSADQAFLARFQAEAAALANLSHPNIAGLYDLLPLDGQLYMIMELVRGHTLEAVLARCKRLGVRESLAIVAQTAAGLSYAHKQDVIHRDIKPSNLMLTESGVLKIMDFGIARVRGSQRLTRAGSIVGTMTYVAPEQIKGGEGDEQSDEYSLACVLYEMLSGDPPFQGETDYDLIKAHVEGRPPPLVERIPDVPAPVEQALMRALAKAPEERFASIEEFSRALGAEADLGHAPEFIRTHVLPLAGPIASPSKRIAPSPSPPPRPAPRLVAEPSPTPPPNRMPAIVLGSTVAVVALGLVYFLWGQDLGGKPASQLVQTEAQNTLPPTISPSTPARPAPEHPSSAQANPTPVRPAVPPPPAPVNPIPVQQLATTKPASANTDLVLNGTNSTTQSVEPTHHDTGLFINNGQSEEPPSQPKPVALATTATSRDVPGLTSSLTAPNERTTYRVANWMVADLLFVRSSNGAGLQPLSLFGIINIDQNDFREQAEAHRKQLNEYMASVHGTISCSDHGGKYQCFGGGQDIALWAVKNGLARPTNDAPAEYRAAEPGR